MIVRTLRANIMTSVPCSIVYHCCTQHTHKSRFCRLKFKLRFLCILMHLPLLAAEAIIFQVVLLYMCCACIPWYFIYSVPEYTQFTILVQLGQIWTDYILRSKGHCRDQTRCGPQRRGHRRDSWPSRSIYLLLSWPFKVQWCQDSYIKNVQCYPGRTYICNFWHSGTLALSPERQSTRMSEIINVGST